MTLNFFKKELPPGTCLVCEGKGVKKSVCKTCNSQGYVTLPGRVTHSACHDCGNLRCVACGGEGRTP